MLIINKNGINEMMILLHVLVDNLPSPPVVVIFSFVFFRVIITLCDIYMWRIEWWKIWLYCRCIAANQWERFLDRCVWDYVPRRVWEKVLHNKIQHLHQWNNKSSWCRWQNSCLLEVRLWTLQTWMCWYRFYMHTYTCHSRQSKTNNHGHCIFMNIY